MKPVTTRTELRWALEDLGENGKPILQYLQMYFEYADALSSVAKSVAMDLNMESDTCDDDDVAGVLDAAVYDLNSIAEEYDKCS